VGRGERVEGAFRLAQLIQQLRPVGPFGADDRIDLPFHLAQALPWPGRRAP